MAIEMVVHLVDGDAFHTLCKRPWKEVYDAAESWTLRDSRPIGDSRLERHFDIDTEVELLDWMDSTEIPRTNEKPFLAEINSAHKENRLGTEAACDGLMHAIQWANIGSWEAWEGRAYLYFEGVLGRKVDDIDQLYEADIWKDISRLIVELTEEEYSTKVIMDWMARREALGETLDEKQDPHILPTMTSHKQLTKNLHYLLSKATSSDSFELIIGRGHLPSHRWGHGEWLLGRILTSPSKLG